MPQFRKRPIVIEAVQWDGDQRTFDVISRWCPVRDAPDNGHDLIIPTLEGDHRALLDDWIIRGIQGECYPCKPDIFAATYEAVT